MVNISRHKSQLGNNGFTIIKNVFSDEQIEQLLKLIDQTDISRASFRKSSDLFAIRQFLKEVPDINPQVFNNDFICLLGAILGHDYFVVKSIYFDKPKQSNWFVAYHQDLTIAVDRKTELEGYNQWTVKQEQFSVQPPLAILKSIYTVRIHLDDTDENNGALKVIPGSHLKDIYRSEDIDWSVETEENCIVPKGGIMIMRPLLQHSSSRTTNNKRRRVIHIEFCNKELHNKLKWIERINLE